MVLQFLFQSSNMIFKIHEDSPLIFTPISAHSIVLIVLSFLKFQASSCYGILSFWRVSFRLSLRVYLLATNALSFPLRMSLLSLYS